MILVATGLKREARILGGPSAQVVAGGGDRGRLELELEGAAKRAAAIISIGLGGALAADLKPGDWVVASGVIQSLEGRDKAAPTDSGWTASLLGMLPGARIGVILGSDFMISDRQAKAYAHLASGAAIVDMESHVVAAVAARYGLPFAVARVVSDAADRTLPAAAQVGMGVDGGMDVLAVIKALAADPRQLPGLIRVGLEAETAFRRLSRGRDLLGPGLGRPDLGELPLDVP
jgi:adenosylhomocysteine nucleosidase